MNKIQLSGIVQHVCKEVKELRGQVFRDFVLRLPRAKAPDQTPLVENILIRIRGDMGRLPILQNFKSGAILEIEGCIINSPDGTGGLMVMAESIRSWANVLTLLEMPSCVVIPTVEATEALAIERANDNPNPALTPTQPLPAAWAFFPPEAPSSGVQTNNMVAGKSSALAPPLPPLPAGPRGRIAPGMVSRKSGIWL